MKKVKARKTTSKATIKAKFYPAPKLDKNNPLFFKTKSREEWLELGYEVEGKAFAIRGPFTATPVAVWLGQQVKPIAK